jgi:hypothetical protein
MANEILARLDSIGAEWMTLNADMGNKLYTVGALLGKRGQLRMPIRRQSDNEYVADFELSELDVLTVTFADGIVHVVEHGGEAAALIESQVL